MKLNFDTKKFKYDVRFSKKFKKEYELAKKRGKNLEKFYSAVTVLASGKKLPAKYQNHKLSGNFSGCFECHLEPDWLLIYQLDDGVLILTLLHLGSHSDLFKE